MMPQPCHHSMSSELHNRAGVRTDFREPCQHNLLYHRRYGHLSARGGVLSRSQRAYHTHGQVLLRRLRHVCAFQAGTQLRHVRSSFSGQVEDILDTMWGCLRGLAVLLKAAASLQGLTAAVCIEHGVAVMCVCLVCRSSMEEITFYGAGHWVGQMLSSGDPTSMTVGSPAPPEKRILKAVALSH